MRFVALALVVAVTGCRGLFGIDEAVVASDAGPDAGGDARTDAARDATTDSALCFGQLTQVCLSALPTMPVSFPASLNTLDGSICTQVVPTGASDMACVIAGTDITVGPSATVSVRGIRSLILIATGRLTIDGTLEFKANPNASANGCGSAPFVMGGSGGAGGSFATTGGRGGGPAGGIAQPIIPIAMRGGCRGQDTANAAGGLPGGGLLLIANQIQVGGWINASGSGGNGAGGIAGGGGGGGGSGGLIALEASSSLLLGASSVLIANGGGGGGGGGSLSGGADGRDPDPNTPLSPAGGGTGGSGGGGGAGAGASFLVSAGVQGGAGSGSNGSGGGGGGGGFIRLRGASITMNGAISPQQTP